MLAKGLDKPCLDDMGMSGADQVSSVAVRPAGEIR